MPRRGKTNDGLFRLGEQDHMKDERIGKTLKSKKKSRTEWPKLAQRSDAGIRAGIRADSNVHATGEQFWKDAEVVQSGVIRRASTRYCGPI